MTAPLEPAFLRGDIGVRKNKRIFLAAPLPLFVPWKESASCQRCYRSQPGQVSKAWSSVRPPAYCSSPLCPLFKTMLPALPKCQAMPEPLHPRVSKWSWALLEEEVLKTYPRQRQSPQQLPCGMEGSPVPGPAGISCWGLPGGIFHPREHIFLPHWPVPVPNLAIS